MLTAVSLFAGVGGFDLALTRAGVDVVAAVEIDAAARGVLADHFPHTTLFEDVQEVTGDQLLAAGFVPERGIVTGGFPCTDLSVAGRRGGLGQGTRSGLFWEIDRLVAELRPAWVVLENVPGLLSAVCPDPDSPEPADATDQLAEGVDLANELMLADEELAAKRGPGACEGGCFPAHGGAMGLVLGSLADRGYGFAYRVLDAQHFGVPQRRRRVFIVGRAGADARGPVQVLLEPESGARHPAARGETRPVVAALTADGVGTCGADDNQAQAGHLIAAAIRAREGKGPDSDATTTLLPIAFDTAQITSPDNRSNPQPGDPAMPLCATGMPHVAHTLTGEGHDASEDGTGRGAPHGTSGVPRPVPSSLAVAGDFSTGEDIAQTVRAANGQPGIAAVPIAATTAVRRLTPLECERLQGFPDGWTATSNGKPQADAGRYRQCGNAVAVPVVEWIAGRLLAVAAAEPANEAEGAVA